MRSEILKAAVQAAHAAEAEAVEKRSKIYMGQRLSSKGRRKKATEMQVAMDVVRDSKRPNHFTLGTGRPNHYAWATGGGWKDGATKIGRETDSRIVRGNLRRQDSYSPSK